jgi:purine-binding chemotaxis protein CheW
MGQTDTQLATARVTARNISSPVEQICQYLTFMLAGDMFAIEIAAIKEIIGYSGLTDVPMMPAYVRGVINLRGAAVPVLDLLLRFGRKSSPVTKRTCIVIIEITTSGGQQNLGVLVDSVDSVLDISASRIEPPPSFGTRIRADFLEGMGNVNGRFVMLLDVDRVLAAEEVESLSEAIRSEPQ